MSDIDKEVAVALLRDLVAIPSVSHQEKDACRWLVSEMRRLGYERAYEDTAGNAVGEIGAIDATTTVILLGHIDTVPGSISVRTEGTGADQVLYGRGAVDAKGPLATFVAAGARLGAAWARAHDTLLVVVGAVEEEAATSTGARHIRDRFDGASRNTPRACIIGEPSGWRRITLGYKGRLLVEMNASQPMAHTAGPDPGIAAVGVDLWSWTEKYAAQFNAGKSKAFDQLLPSLRQINTVTDDDMNDRVLVRIGIRLPMQFDALDLASELTKWFAERIDTNLLPDTEHDVLNQGEFHLAGSRITATLRFHGYERAWRAERNSFLVRSFLAAIRDIEPAVRPSFVVKTGTSDMNVVAPAWQCPILAYGPGDSSLDHTPNEHLNLDEYWRAILVLEKALHNLAMLSGSQSDSA